MKNDKIGKVKLLSFIALPLGAPKYIHEHRMIKDGEDRYRV